LRYFQLTGWLTVECGVTMLDTVVLNDELRLLVPGELGIVLYLTVSYVRVRACVCVCVWVSVTCDIIVCVYIVVYIVTDFIADSRQLTLLDRHHFF